MSTRLIGRDALIDSVTAAVGAGRRAMTLLGPPGVGKSRVAEAAAARLGPDRPGGVWSTSLAGATSEEALCVAVRSIFDDGSAGSIGPQVATEPAGVAKLGALLAARGRALIVLDDFERVVSSAGVVRRWLDMAPELAFLVTSRERLNIDDEMVIEVAALTESEASRLFQARAIEAGAPAFDDTDAIAEIVRRLDGIPLAIELAAARTRVMPPAELARRITLGLDSLSRSPRGPARHQTLRAAIAWSWDLLEPDERHALTAMSVFAGGFTAAAAEAIIVRALTRANRSADGSSPLDLVAALRDKSLLRIDLQGRLSLYASVRDFAAHELARNPEAERRVRLDHLTACAGVARAFLDERLLQGTAPTAGAVAAAREERENLVAALDFALRDASSARPLVDSLPLAVALAAAVAFLQAAPADRCDANLARLLDRPELDPAEQAVLLLARQSSLGALGRHAEGLWVAESVMGLPEVGVGLRAAACAYAGIQVRNEGDVERAVGFHEQAAAMLGERHPSRLYGMNLSCLGRLACDRRRLDEARELNRRATAICDDRGDRFLAGLGIANLAQLEQEEGNFSRAEAGYEEAIARFSAAHEPQYEGIYAAHLAGLYLEWRKPDRALDRYAAAARTMQRVHAPSSMVLLLAGWAAAAADEGRFREATEQLAHARLVAERGAQGVMGVALELLGGVVDLASPAIEPAAVTAWRSRLTQLQSDEDPNSRTARQNLDVRFALRLLSRALARRDPAPPMALELGPDLAWFALGEGERVDLARRGPLRRMLVALVGARLSRPGSALDRDALASAGWPNERILDQAAASRVRVGIATLRKLGLRDVLVTRDDGYLIDPSARIVENR